MSRRSIRRCKGSDARLVFLDEVVDADDDLVARLDRLLEPIRRLGDLLLRIPLDRFDHSAHAVDDLEIVLRTPLHVEGQPLEEVGAAERVNHVGDTAFMGDDLRRVRSASVAASAVGSASASSSELRERVRSAEHRRQRLERSAHHVVARLLRREGYAGGLRGTGASTSARSSRRSGRA